MSKLSKYSYKNNKLFYHNLMRLAIPMGLTSLLGSLLNLIDTLMITSLGASAVAAVGSANKVFFVMIVTLYGVYSGFGVFISQYWGKKDIKRLQTVFMTAIMTGIIISTIVSLIAIIYPEQVIRAFSKDIEVIDMGIQYLRVVAFSYIISAIVFSIEMVSRSTENVKLPMIVSSIGVGVNTLLNIVFIFGLNVHFKGDIWFIQNININITTVAMGVTGAAIATIIARGVQLSIYIGFIFITKHQVLYFKISHFIYDSTLFKRMLVRVSPVVGNEFV